jgi:hypothetical protein
VPQCLLGRIVGRLDPFDIHKGPQMRATLPQLFAEVVTSI